MPTYLNNLKALRIKHGILPKHLASLANIGEARFRTLENLSDTCEPWLDEALTLARVLNTSGVIPLISASGTLTDKDYGLPLGDDIAIWHSGVRLPLSNALRVSRAFGLADPCDLTTSPLQRQLWSTLEASERNPEAVGWCPWCAADILGGAPHLRSCLPNNIHGPRNSVDPTSLGTLPQAHNLHTRRSSSAPANGLKRLRMALMLTQKAMAEKIHMAQNYYARIERGDVPLTEANADKIAAACAVPKETLYVSVG